MQNVSVWLIRRNLKVLTFLLQYKSNKFPVIRLQEHQAVEKDDEDVHLACNVTIHVELDHGAP